MKPGGRRTKGCVEDLKAAAGTNLSRKVTNLHHSKGRKEKLLGQSKALLSVLFRGEKNCFLVLFFCLFGCSVHRRAGLVQGCPFFCLSVGCQDLQLSCCCCCYEGRAEEKIWGDGVRTFWTFSCGGLRGSLERGWAGWRQLPSWLTPGRLSCTCSSKRRLSRPSCQRGLS